MIVGVLQTSWQSTGTGERKDCRGEPSALERYCQKLTRLYPFLINNGYRPGLTIDKFK